MEELDPIDEDKVDSREWNLLLNIAKNDFSVIYDDLIMIREMGCRIVKDYTNKHAMRFDAPAGLDGEQRKAFINTVTEQLSSHSQSVNVALKGVCRIKQGLPYKIESTAFSSILENI